MLPSCTFFQHTVQQTKNFCTAMPSTIKEWWLTNNGLKEDKKCWNGSNIYILEETSGNI